jgi:hypothetical protein
MDMLYHHLISLNVFSKFVDLMTHPSLKVAGAFNSKTKHLRIYNGRSIFLSTNCLHGISNKALSLVVFIEELKCLLVGVTNVHNHDEAICLGQISITNDKWETQGEPQDAPCYASWRSRTPTSSPTTQLLDLEFTHKILFFSFSK